MTDAAAAAVAAALDANALFPSRLRDTLLDLAHAGLYRPVWSAETLAELRRNLVGRSGPDAAQVDALIAALRMVFPAATVAPTRYAPLQPRLTNHPKDRHVLAAALAAGARVIVTFNLRDFPTAALAPWEVTAQTPDDFLCARFAAAPATVVQTVSRQAARYRHPPMVASELLDRLAGQTPAFVALLRAILPPAPA